MTPYTLSDLQDEGVDEYQRCFKCGVTAFRQRNFPSARLWFFKAFNAAMTESEDYESRQRQQQCDEKIRKAKGVQHAGTKPEDGSDDHDRR